MKKVTSVFFISIAVLATTFFSCKLKIEDENLYDKPLASATNKQVTIVIPLMNTDTKYINVYRRDKKNDEAINIGILYHPYALENDQKNYIYNDKLVKKEHSYQYRCRYCIGSNYYFTEWSDTVDIKKDYEFYNENTSLAYKLNDANLIYEKTADTIHFDKTLTAPNFAEFDTEKYKPMIIINNGKKTQAFELKEDAVRSRLVVPLVGMLPADFLDTNITIEAIVGQKKVYVNNKQPANAEEEDKFQVKKIIWTEPTPVKVVGAGADKIINVKSQTGKEGLDYSRKAN